MLLLQGIGLARWVKLLSIVLGRRGRKVVVKAGEGLQFLEAVKSLSTSSRPVMTAAETSASPMGKTSLFSWWRRGEPAQARAPDGQLVQQIRRKFADYHKWGHHIIRMEEYLIWKQAFTAVCWHGILVRLLGRCFSPRIIHQFCVEPQGWRCSNLLLFQGAYNYLGLLANFPGYDANQWLVHGQVNIFRPR